MSWLLVLEGMFLKLITGADDTATHAPLVSALTKTKNHKFAILSGMFVSILAILVISFFFADVPGQNFWVYRFVYR